MVGGSCGFIMNLDADVAAAGAQDKCGNLIEKLRCTAALERALPARHSPTATEPGTQRLSRADAIDSGFGRGYAGMPAAGEPPAPLGRQPKPPLQISGSRALLISAPHLEPVQLKAPLV